MNQRQDLRSLDDEAAEAVETWLQRFNEAASDPSPGKLASLFLPDSHWREILALSWELKTVSGSGEIGRALAQALPRFQARGF
ncbi:MAG: hypothetical protein H7Y16_04480, partial [Candidatus Parcubacteria bacterium]|nr:hypothetical protein [Burkholderiales bacterium]